MYTDNVYWLVLQNWFCLMRTPNVKGEKYNYSNNTG